MTNTNSVSKPSVSKMVKIVYTYIAIHTSAEMRAMQNADSDAMAIQSQEIEEALIQN